VIVRLLTEGQYEVSEELTARLNELDERAIAALDRDDEPELDAMLDQMWKLVQAEGERLEDGDLRPSDVVVPPADLTLEETRLLFSGDGLIPDIPSGESD
jgi:PspA-Associated protein